ncbi:hypothetical protein SLS62_006288 [Diatrype stigma]|uniref:Uncharacterized protein n=1 Tax=Diatrype stigma TaxID=117547 RepID=A0AAN9YRF8_9PEZI
MPTVYQGGLRMSRLREADTVAEHLYQLSVIGGNGDGNGDDDLTTNTTTAAAAAAAAAGTTASYAASDHKIEEITVKFTVAVAVAVSPPRQDAAPAPAPSPAPWDMYVARMFDNFVWRSYGAGWLDRAAGGHLGDLSLDAVKALSQFSFGQSNQTPEIQTRGDARYGKCIVSLRVEIQGSTGAAASGSKILCPILILTMIACIQKDRAAAFSHLGAVDRLLRTSGPELFQQQSLRSAFEAARSTLLITSLMAKQRLFLEEHPWRTVPWALEPASKRPQAHLLDILVTIPGLLKDEKRLLLNDDDVEEEEQRRHEEDVHHRCPQAAGEPIGISPPEWLISSDRQLVCRRVTLRNNIADQLEKLYRWRWDWQHQNGRHVTVGPACWQPGDPAWNVLGGGGGKREGRLLNRLVFDSPTHANDIMLYNATLIWLMALLWKVDPARAAGVIEDCARRARTNRPPSYHSSHQHDHDNHPQQQYQQYRHQNENQHHINQQPSPMLKTPPCPSEPGDIKDGAQTCPCPCLCPGTSPLPSPGPSPTLSFEPLSQPGDTTSIRDPAIEICRVYDWQAQHHHRNPHPSSSSSAVGEDQICLYLFPMGIARGVLEADLGSTTETDVDVDVDVDVDLEDRDPDVRDWIRDMLGSNPVTQDYFGAGSNVAGFPSYITRRALYPDEEAEAGADDNMDMESAEEAGMRMACGNDDDVFAWENCR